MAKNVNKNYKNVESSINVVLIDTTFSLPIQRNSLGNEVLNAVFEYLNLSEPEYFGLQFKHPNETIILWVEPNKKIQREWDAIKTVNDSSTPTVKFKVRFYPIDPSILKGDDTRHQIYLQIRHDIYRGKLPCSLSIACILASYIAQAELGDFIAIKHGPTYLSRLKLIRGQNIELERRISDMHKLHRGQLPSDAEFNYLEHAKRLPMYGVDLHKLSSTKFANTQLGVRLTGLTLYKNGELQETFPWRSIATTSFSRKDFIIKTKPQGNGDREKTIKYTMDTIAHAKSVFNSCASHYLFTKRTDDANQVPRVKNNKLAKIFSTARSIKIDAKATQQNKIQNKVKENQEYNKKIMQDDTFRKSLLLLSQTLGSRTLDAQYEQVYHENLAYPITVAHKKENHRKNRYANVSPYDYTRVILKHPEFGNYINASYINMTINSKKVNRYIATQGPLANTTADFWRMVQQEKSHLIVMLTTVMELGIPKCHPYWPALGNKVEVSPDLWIKCAIEQSDKSGSYVFRELLLFDRKIKETRAVQQMQYLAWPDHGVPSETLSFLRFTKRVDDLRSSTAVNQYINPTDPPIIIHCSAGIGRTGVLILMDTAMTMMRFREPIYPLVLLKQMRDQRPGMIQHYNQFRFVCECINEIFTKL